MSTQLPLGLRSIFSNKSVDPDAFNFRKKRSPEIIFVPDNIGQVSEIVREANKQGKKVAARCGGHSYASYGLGGLDGAWIIDLQKFDKVVVDHDNDTARIGAGNRLGKVALDLFHQGRKAIPHGLCPRVGVAGHSLHGGFGFTSRLWGLALDSIIEAQVVLPNGDILYASNQSDMHRDLFFGILGAGSSFGIVTEFNMRLKQAPEQCVHYWLTWSDLGKPLPEAENLAKIFKCFQTFAPNAPNKLAFRFRILRNYVEVTGAYWGTKKEFLTELKPFVDELVSQGVPPDDYREVLNPDGTGPDQIGDFRTGVYNRTWVEMLVYIANDDHLQKVLRARKYMSQISQFVFAQFNNATGSDFLNHYGVSEKAMQVGQEQLAVKTFRFLGEHVAKPGVLHVVAPEDLPVTKHSYKPGESSKDPVVTTLDLPTQLLRADPQPGDVVTPEQLIKVSRATLNDTFFASSVLVKDRLADDGKALFEYIRNEEPAPVQDDNWFLIIDTYGGDQSKIKHGDNRPFSCYSFRDHLFTMQFYISIDALKNAKKDSKPHVQTAESEDNVLTPEESEREAINYIHGMRDTVMEQQEVKKMYMCYVDPEDQNRLSAEHYYDEVNPLHGADPQDPDKDIPIYNRLKTYKQKYDPRHTLWNPQSIPHV